MGIIAWNESGPVWTRAPVEQQQQVAQQIMWSGHGPPTLVIGASPGDCYVDVDTGMLYQLK